MIYKGIKGPKYDLSTRIWDNDFLLFLTRSFEASTDDVIGMTHQLWPQKREIQT